MIVAHDLGTTGNKASLHDDEGRTLAAVTVDYPANFAAGGIAEQDPEHWWEAVGTATRRLLDAAGVPGSAVAGPTTAVPRRPTGCSPTWARTRPTAGWAIGSTPPTRSPR